MRGMGVYLSAEEKAEQGGRGSHEFTGRHLLVSYFDCDAEKIRDTDGLLSAMKEAVRASGATLLKSVEQSFSPEGMAAVFLLSESHASIHTYPEHASCFVDLFTCGNSCRAELFDEVMRGFLLPAAVNKRIFIRNHETVEDE